jgi:hypothetical protein
MIPGNHGPYESTDTEGSHDSLPGKQIPEDVMIGRMFRAFFFGARDKLQTAPNGVKQEPEILGLPPVPPARPGQSLNAKAAASPS